MAETTVKIGDVAAQLITASRLVVSTDFFWVYAKDGTQEKIPAELVRAYILAGGILTDELYKKAVGLVADTTETELELIPNVLYRWTCDVTSLTLTFAAGDSSVVNEYMMRFKVGTGTPSITFPEGTKWVEEPSWTVGSTYEVSVINGYALAAEWEG